MESQKKDFLAGTVVLLNKPESMCLKDIQLDELESDSVAIKID
jgi:hypothetical protein